MPQMQQNLNTLYKQLYQYISDGLQESLRTGKPLVIAVGEKHKPFLDEKKSESVYECTAVELMTFDIARKLGIKTVIAEADRKLLNLIDEGGGQAPFSSVVLEASYGSGFYVIPGDPNRRSSDPEMRQKGIERVIAIRTNPVVGIYGANHLEHIGKSNLSETHTMRLINASNLSPAERQQSEKEGTRQAEINTYIHDPNNAFQAVVSGDIRKVAERFIDVKTLIAETSLQFDRSIDNKDLTEKNYMKALESTLKAENVFLNNKIKKELSDIYTVLAASGNQLQTAEFQKELNEFTAQLAPNVKAKIDSIKR